LLNNNESPMGKNYWMALILSMVILLGYPVLLRKIIPQKAPVAGVSQSSQSSQNNVALENTAPVLEAPKLAQATLTHYENTVYDIYFSTMGATLTHLKYKGQPEKTALTETVFYEGLPAEPGVFGIRFLHETNDLTQQIFTQVPSDQAGTFIFSFEKPGEYRLTKKYILSDEKTDITLHLLIENLSSREKHFPIEFLYAFDHDQSHEMARDVEAVVFQEKVESKNVSQIAKKEFSFSGELKWAGFLKKYFAMLAKPDWKPLENEAVAETGRLRGVLRMDPISLDAGQRAEQEIVIYAGPQHYETLKSFGADFENVFARGIFGIFKVLLLKALKFLDGFTHNYGWAIILLTLFLKGAFTPLTHMSFQSMKKMQALQPKLKSIQERYKKDPTKMNREMMELYKRNKVNPMGGCLPMLAQIPVFISFYQVLNGAIELKGAPFIFWIKDLAEPDRLLSLPFTLPVIGDSLNLLPLLMLISMVWQQKLTPQSGATPEQTKMMAFTPIIFGFLFYKMPSGLVLYWFVNNVLSIIHQTFVKKMVVVLHHEDKE